MNKQIALQVLGGALSNLAWKVGASSQLATLENALQWIEANLPEEEPAPSKEEVATALKEEWAANPV